MNNRTISKFLFVRAFISAVVMAVFKFAPSFSQNALGQYDSWLRAYLGAGSLGFAFLASDAENREELVKIIFFKVQWGYVFLWMSLAFLAVSITNVSQIYVPHLISTAFVIIGASVLPLYFDDDNKKWSFIAIITSILYFLGTYLLNWHTIAYGELAVTFVALCLTWIIINEKLQK